MFRQHLSLPLLTIEWSPVENFQLASDDAELLVQVGGGDLLWQKERLLNIGLSHLPGECEYVAWIDADVIFSNPRWIEMALAQLKDNDVVQLFSTITHLAPDTNWPKNSNSPFRYSGAVSVAKQALSLPEFLKCSLDLYHQRFCKDGHTHYVPHLAFGFAWAAKRSWLTDISGLNESCIIGSGDAFFFFALIGHLLDLIEVYRCHDAAYMDCAHLRNWANRINHMQASIGYLDGNINHLFHGSLENRHYLERAQLLTEAGFQVDSHLIDDPGKPLKLSPGCPSQVIKVIDTYFKLRNEDANGEAKIST